jgi:hypothetical protein
MYGNVEIGLLVSIFRSSVFAVKSFFSVISAYLLYAYLKTQGLRKLGFLNDSYVFAEFHFPHFCELKV